MQIIIKNPLEQFEILDLFSISTSLLGYRFVLTNLGLYISIAVALSCLIGIWIASENKKLLLHSYGSIISESIYATILQMVRNQIGSKGELYLPIIFTLFIFILFNNLVGLVPYAFTPTSHLDLFTYFYLRKFYTNFNPFNDNNVSPIKSYDYANPMEKLKMIKDNKGKSGTQRTLSETNGNSYIGNAKNLDRRLTQHNRGKASNTLLQRAILKYGL